MHQLPEASGLEPLNGGEGLLVDDDSYQPRTSEEVGRVVELHLDNFEF